MGTCLWAASSPTVGFGFEHADDSSHVCDGCKPAFGAGLMSATGCTVAAAHRDLDAGVGQLHTIAYCMPKWTHCHCRVFDSQGSGLRGEGHCKADAP